MFPGLRLGDLVSVDNGDDNKGVGPGKGTPGKYSNTNCRIPVTFLQKSSDQSKAKETEQMWPDEIHHSPNTD